jgi:hypothetical protein
MPDLISVPYIKADPVRISFIFESVFSYLLRYASRERPIEIGIHQEKHFLVLTIAGSEPDSESGEDSQGMFIKRMRADIAIGRRMLETFTESQRGVFFKPVRQDGRILFRMKFPISEMENVA